MRGDCHVQLCEGLGVRFPWSTRGFSALGKAKEALDYFKQALAMRKRLYPDQDHPDTATSLNNVGASFSALGEAKGGFRV